MGYEEDMQKLQAWYQEECARIQAAYPRETGDDWWGGPAKIKLQRLQAELENRREALKTKYKIRD